MKAQTAHHRSFQHSTRPTSQSYTALLTPHFNNPHPSQANRVNNNKRAPINNNNNKRAANNFNSSNNSSSCSNFAQQQRRRWVAVEAVGMERRARVDQRARPFSTRRRRRTSSYSSLRPAWVRPARAHRLTTSRRATTRTRPPLTSWWCSTNPLPPPLLIISSTTNSSNSRTSSIWPRSPLSRLSPIPPVCSWVIMPPLALVRCGAISTRIRTFVRIYFL